MLKNYITVAYRHLLRNKAFTLINLMGLSIGMAACCIILLFVQDAYRYDRFHTHADRLYRVAPAEITLTPGILGPAMAETFPGVETYTRLLPTLGDVLIRQGDDQRFYERRFYWADENFFSTFSYTLVEGHPEAVLAGVNTVVVTESMAQKYFGARHPIGEKLIFDVGQQIEFEVTGIMADPPAQSHLRPDFVASIRTFESNMMRLDDWDHSYMLTYVLLDAQQPPDAIEIALPAFFEQHTGEAWAGYTLQPITDIHLYSKRQREQEPPGDVGYVYTFALIAGLILLIACINFMNLSTARSAHRAQEVSMRKVLGADRPRLIRQFMGESVLLSVLALLLVPIWITMALPYFNHVAGKTLHLGAVSSGVWLAMGVGLVVVVGGGSGCYPALFLSRFAPLQVLKGTFGVRSPRIRQVLVVGQFTMGLVLAIGALVAHQQLGVLQTHQVGFDKEQVVVVSARMYGHMVAPLPIEAMVNQFKAIPGVRAAAASGDVPGTPPRQSNYRPEGLSSTDAIADLMWSVYRVDVGLVETLNLNLHTGRSFRKGGADEEDRAVVINEAAQQQLIATLGSAWEAPVGRRLDRYVRMNKEWVLARPGKVIGVVKDFNYASLHHHIQPLVLEMGPQALDQFIIRIAPGDVAPTLAALEAIWMQHLPERPFEYYFLDAAFDELYRAEARITTLLNAFTGLGLLIACMGLFGLAAFTAERRYKEIGIRKVVGASTWNVVILLTREFTFLVLIAFGLAVPIAYFSLEPWLNSFAYRTDIQMGAVLLTGVAALLLAWLTVGYQSLRAAWAPPVDAIRQS